MVFRNISTEFLEEAIVLPDGKPLIAKLLLKYPPEIDATQLQKILKSHWKCEYHAEELAHQRDHKSNFHSSLPIGET